MAFPDEDTKVTRHDGGHNRLRLRGRCFFRHVVTFLWESKLATQKMEVPPGLPSRGDPARCNSTGLLPSPKGRRVHVKLTSRLTRGYQLPCACHTSSVAYFGNSCTSGMPRNSRLKLLHSLNVPGYHECKSFEAGALRGTKKPR